MEFLHYTVNAGPDDVVVVSLDRQANVLLLDESSFAGYQSGRSFNYRGGWQRSSPVRLCPPHQGRWHVVIDLAGRGGTIRSGVQVLCAERILSSWERE